MTFEEYLDFIRPFDGSLYSGDKKHSLATYRERYQQHLLKIEDDKYFEPVTHLSGNDVSSRYEAELDSFMGIDAVLEGQIYFLVIPSFQAEYLITLTLQEDGYMLEHVSLNDSFWQLFYNGANTGAIQKRTERVLLSAVAGQKMFFLLHNELTSAKLPAIKMIYLDGMKYKIAGVVNNEIVKVHKHSPDPSTAPGKIVSFMEKLISLIPEKEQIENMIHSFAL